MSATQRAALISKLHKVAKKHFSPVKPPSNRSVLEHLLYACCLENSTFESADESLARLQENFFDWNEVRVTTVVELSENMSSLTDPNDGANRLKKTLHSVFEAHYSYEIDSLQKENLGKAVQSLQQHKHISPFVVSYVSQNALGGHSIPIDKAMIQLFQCLDLMSEKDAANFKVTGLERTIPKNKGVEFFSVVHQLAVALYCKPFGTEIRKIITSIDASAKDRLPKRQTKKKAAKKDEPKAVKKSPPKKKTKAVAKTAATSKPASKKVAKKKAVASKKAAKKVVKKPAKKKTAATKKTATKKSSAAKKATKKKTTRKSPTKQLARKKPR